MMDDFGNARSSQQLRIEIPCRGRRKDDRQARRERTSTETTKWTSIIHIEQRNQRLTKKSRSAAAAMPCRRNPLASLVGAIMNKRIRLPNRHPSETQQFDRDGTTITLTVGYKPDGSPGEIFLNANAPIPCSTFLMSDAAIVASLALQHGVPLQQLAHAVKRDRFGIASSPIGAALDRIHVPEVINAEK